VTFCTNVLLFCMCCAVHCGTGMTVWWWGKTPRERQTRVWCWLVLSNMLNNEVMESDVINSEASTSDIWWSDGVRLSTHCMSLWRCLADSVVVSRTCSRRNFLWVLCAVSCLVLNCDSAIMWALNLRGWLFVLLENFLEATECRKMFYSV